MAIKQIVALSPYQDPTGNVLAGGTLTLDLSQPAVATGSGEVVPLRITVALNSSGTFSATNLWANDQLTPSGTTYRLRAYNNNGLLAGDWGAMSIQGTSPIDISALIPLVTVPSVSLGAVLLNPGGLQTITGFPLAAPAFQSSNANPAQSGVVRLANADGIVWRNNANTVDMSLRKDVFDLLVLTDFSSVRSNSYQSGSANPSVSGLFRLATNELVTWRNNINNADVALSKNASDNLVFPNGFSVGGEAAFSGSPRSTLTVFFPGPLTSTWTGATWVLTKPIAATQVRVQVKTAPIGNSPNAVIRIGDGVSNVDTTISAAANGGTSAQFWGTTTLTVAVITAAVGGTPPADAVFTMEYRTQ